MIRFFTRCLKLYIDFRQKDIAETCKPGQKDIKKKVRYSHNTPLTHFQRFNFFTSF
jgi:acyl-CoA-binding protein